MSKGKFGDQGQPEVTIIDFSVAFWENPVLQTSFPVLLFITWMFSTQHVYLEMLKKRKQTGIRIHCIFSLSPRSDSN